MKFSAAVVLATAASASAFAPQPAFRVSTTALNMEKGAGGMFDTRNPDAQDHEDPRKSISAAPSFEEYMKNRGGGAAAPAPAAPAPAAPAPVAAAPAGDGPIDWSSFSAAPAAAAPAAAAPVAAPPAPAAPAVAAVPAEGGFQYGAYDDKLWSNDAKKEVYAAWDPNSPRSTLNFNPFETFDGNSPDASGIYPGEQRYKDPMRPDVSYASMMEEKAEIEERNANPKPGYTPGCPGCKN